jgi:hypothetical protein
VGDGGAVVGPDYAGMSHHTGVMAQEVLGRAIGAGHEGKSDLGREALVRSTFFTDRQTIPND